jgi:ferredoxin--NADP+ reductase
LEEVVLKKSDVHDCAIVCAERSLRELLEAGVTNRVLRKERLAESIILFELDNPLVARRAKAGQFVVVRPNQYGERIPLTISDTDPDRGTITIIFQIVGRTTMELGQIEEGECVRDVCGPLGRPTEIEHYGTTLSVGGGVGIAFLRPITKALKRAGNEVITIIGAREKGLLILEDEMRELSDELFITTDDGSYGRRGFVTEVVEELLRGPGTGGGGPRVSHEQPAASCGPTAHAPCPMPHDRRPDIVFAIGPMPMMRAVAEVTRPFGVKTIVSLDPIMIDGTGMCGGCRVSVGGRTRFTCVDGPDFDAHDVDWEELATRKGFYAAEERRAKESLPEESKR